MTITSADFFGTILMILGAADIFGRRSTIFWSDAVNGPSSTFSGPIAVLMGLIQLWLGWKIFTNHSHQQYVFFSL